MSREWEHQHRPIVQAPASSQVDRGGRGCGEMHCNTAGRHSFTSGGKHRHRKQQQQGTKQTQKRMEKAKDADKLFLVVVANNTSSTPSEWIVCIPSQKLLLWNPRRMLFSTTIAFLSINFIELHLQLQERLCVS